MPRARVLGAGLVGVALAVVGVATLGGDDVQPSGAASQSTQTTEIRQQDLVESESVDGTLGYDDSRTVVNAIAGTLTWAPKVGSVVRTNHRLYKVDDTLVYLLDGTYPAYRTLGPGLSGTDVLQLERNLRKQGLDEDKAMTVDGSWDAGTTSAVYRWQARKGMTQDGTIEKGRIVFQPGSRRIGAVNAEVGAAAAADAGAAGGGLMQTTSTRHVVTVDLLTTKLSLAIRGSALSVDLPTGKRVKGTIVSVGKVAEKKVSAGDDDPPATIEVVIKLASAKGTAGLDQAPVDVQLERRRAKDVLTVPVTALLAREGGEFALEVRDGGERRVVPVETGLYTDRFVEISGDGLRAGMLVTDAGI